ncbi:hypothetical protein HMPREF9137_2282 [Prevotella denticola F0289]|nr:hypothetical protein HMPREF9137_2282 [Prevotella denticola F0289]
MIVFQKIVTGMKKMLACITNGCGRYKCLFQSLTARNVSIGKAHFRTRL